MRRLLVVAAVAAGSSGVFWPVAPARAASQLELYGVVDVGLATTRVSGLGTRQQVLGGGQTDNLWGLRGTEELDGGWRASFGLESGFDAANGTRNDDARLFDYGTWVGLGHAGVGELSLGRQQSIGLQYGGQLEIASWRDMGMGALFKASDNYRVNNLVNYLSPAFSGWQWGVGYAFDVESGATQRFDRSPAFSTGLKYEAGPLLATVTWDKLNLHDTSATDGRSPQALQAGFTYDFEALKMALAWSRQRNGFVGLNGGGQIGLGPEPFAHGGAINAWLLGLEVPVQGNGAWLMQGAMARPDWHWANGQQASKAYVVTLGYRQDLSARTSLYAYGGYMKGYDPEDPFASDVGRATRFGVGMTQRF